MPKKKAATPVVLVEGGLPQDQLDELKGLVRNGELHTIDVVKHAEDPSSALHDQFEWDDSIAAHQHRLAQARQLIGRVKVKIVSQPGKSTRAFVSVHTAATNERVYRPVGDVLASPVDREQHRQRLIQRLERIQEDLAAFEEFTDLAVAVGLVISDLRNRPAA
jgi:chaperonin cofactor prefoldin